MAQLLAQATPVDVDGAQAPSVRRIPNVAQDLLAREDATWSLGEVREQGELAHGEGHGVAAGMNALPRQVDDEALERQALLIGPAPPMQPNSLQDFGLVVR